MNYLRKEDKRRSKFEIVRTVILFSVIAVSYSAVMNQVLPDRPRDSALVRLWNKVMRSFSGYDHSAILKENGLKILTGTPSNAPLPKGNYKVDVTPSNPPPLKKATKISIKTPNN